MTQSPKGIYLISKPYHDEVFLSRLETLLQTKQVTYFQLRLKTTPNNLTPITQDEIKHLAPLYMDICKKHHVKFILNDNPSLAIQLKANGVHIGEDDANALTTIQTLQSKNFDIGISCYSKLQRALEACSGKITPSYIAFGAFFGTTSKIVKYPNPQPKIMQEFKQQHPNIPICAIGGINLTNYHLLQYQNIKPDLIALISAGWDIPIMHTLQTFDTIYNFLNTKLHP